jgi:hypothetical protein
MVKVKGFAQLKAAQSDIFSLLGSGERVGISTKTISFWGLIWF